MKRLGRPNLQGSKDLDALLIEVGGKLFMSQGFDGTSMDQVAAVAEVSKHSLYRRYPNKEALFLVAFSQLFRDLKEKWLKIHHDSMTEKSPHHQDALGDFKFFARAIFDVSTDPDSLAVTALVFQEKGRFPILREDIDEITSSQYKETIRHIKMLQSAGIFRSSNSPNTEKHFIALFSSWPIISLLVGNSDIKTRQAKNDYFESAWEAFISCHRV